MGIDQQVNCLSQISQLLTERLHEGIINPGSITHSIEQLRESLRLESQGHLVELERSINRTITTPTGVEHVIGRIIDIASSDFVQTVHKEIKTGLDIRSALNLDQLKDDAIISMMDGVRNVWRLANIEMNDNTKAIAEQRLTKLANDLLQMGFSPQQVEQAFKKLNIEDAAGKTFDAAIKFTFGPDGPIAESALHAASHSPDFSPAMNVIFGPSGKVADSATEAAQGANLKPATDALEKKVEEGVTGALNQAGDKSKAAAAAALASKVGAGATALGNILTSVPQFYDSITALGEAWDKPLKSTKDYMTLFSAAGNAINQGVQMFQALAGVTQIAAAAQAIFNAVMAMNPIVLIVIAVIALIAAIALVIIYWDQVKAALRDNPWLAVAAVMFGLIGIIIVIIAYWDEIKLAALQAANFVSIQIQRIGQFFVGLGTLVGQVWDFIVATAANVGIGIINMFITVGVQVQNFFIGLVNAVLSLYNEIAGSVIGDVLGLSKADLIPEVDVQTKLIPPKDVPEVSLDAAFKFDDVKGGLEGQIAAQQQVVQQGQAEDEARRAQASQAQPPPPPVAAPPALPAGAGLPPPGAPPVIPAGLGAPAAGGAGGPVDASVTVNGGITVNINAEKLEASAAQMLSDEIINGIQARLSSLRSEQDFRTGNRAAAA